MADDDMAEADRAEHHLLDKGFGALLREIEVEMLDEQQVDAEPLDLALLDPERGQPERFAFRHADAARMRLEGLYHGGLAVRPRAPAPPALPSVPATPAARPACPHPHIHAGQG